ncbi:MAG: PEP-CTERM sorting domain-containing protein [Gammaproteobacteria bacterium]|nr:PEP-CTERM sorting domain-containing protein [Gammaproteobacteria bacterium]
MKKILTFMVFVFVYSSNTLAYPVLTFNGGMNYSADTGYLTISGALDAALDVTPFPDLATTTFELTTQFTGISAFSNSSMTVADFTGIGDTSLIISDAVSGILLQGDLSYIEMRGTNGSNRGFLFADFVPATGLLLDQFSPLSGLVAFQLNLTNAFSTSMFETSFSGNVNGDVSNPDYVSVPEPSIFALLAIGLVATFITRKKINN